MRQAQDTFAHANMLLDKFSLSSLQYLAEELSQLLVSLLREKYVGELLDAIKSV
jgi:hypothetical protein